MVRKIDISALQINVRFPTSPSITHHQISQQDPTHKSITILLWRYTASFNVACEIRVASYTRSLNRGSGRFGDSQREISKIIKHSYQRVRRRISRTHDPTTVRPV